MNDTFDFDIGTNDMDGNPDTPKFAFMGEAIDPLEDEEPFDISGFFTDMLVDMEPFDYLKPFDEFNEFGKYYMQITCILYTSYLRIGAITGMLL